MTIQVPEQILKMHLQDGGLLAPWTDMNGNQQPAPEVQLFEFDETGAGDERIMLIRNAGPGSGDYLVLSPAYDIIVFSKSAPGDQGFARYYAELVKRYLLANYRKEGIISIELTGDVAGPMILDSGRRAYEISLSIDIDTEVIN